MTKSHEFYKEDIEPDALDDHIWRMEREMLAMEEFLRDEKEIPNIAVGNPVKRFINSKYGKTRIRIADKLPF